MALGLHFFGLVKLKSNFHVILGPSWVGLGTISADFWVDFLDFLGTCLGSRFDMDF